MSIILFGIGGFFLLLAYVVGVKGWYGLIAGVNTASKEKQAKMNIPGICRATGIGLGVMGVAAIIAAIMNLVGIPGAMEIWFVVVFLGMWFLVLYVQKYDGNNFNSDGSLKKRFYIFTIGFSAFVLAIGIFIGVMISWTVKDPTVTFTKENMVIEGMYGIELAKADVKGISLLETPLEFNSKSNGSSALGACKGNFESAEMGSVLAYTKDGSAPWICILRQEKPVVLCLSTKEATMKLYQEMVAWMEDR